MKPTRINIGKEIWEFSTPQIMAIINITPDSFAVSCKSMSEKEVLECAEKALSEGASILDLGGYSTRPGAEEVSAEEEWHRIDMAAGWIRKEWPDALLSIDTFRADVARKAVEKHGANIINDISGGDIDPDMFATVAELGTPYILTHMRGTPQTMQQLTQYDHFMQEIVDFFQKKTDQLHRMGVKDIILDPGFGFAKTREQNFELLRKMRYLEALNLPILAGISRKSMIYKTLDITPSEALNGTTALHMAALIEGASILRVHDVKEAKQTITLYQNCYGI